VNAGKRTTGADQSPRPSSFAEQQLLIGQYFTTIKGQQLLSPIDVSRLGAQSNSDMVLIVETLVPDQQSIRGQFSREVFLRQGGSLVREHRFVTDQRK
jgi:hypothetical protein